MPHAYWLALFAGFGACVGSFLNVVIYRVPAGLSIVHPPSHCPVTGKPLAWWENIPILSFLILRGRSRHSGTPISLQYPLVELTTAVLFGLLYAAYFWPDSHAQWQVVFGDAWAVLVVHLVLVACLIASTRIDAKLFIIPVQITWLAAGVAVVAQPVIAAVWPTIFHVFPAAQVMWLLPTAGAALGLVVSLVLLRMGVLPQSFADEEEVLAAQQAERGERESKPSPSGDADQEASGDGKVGGYGTGNLEMVAAAKADAATLARRRRMHWVIVLGSLTLAALAAIFGGLVGKAAGLLVFWWAGLIYDTDEASPDEPGEGSASTAEEAGPEAWLAYPHARREMLKEALFLAFPLVGFAAGWALNQAAIIDLTQRPPAVYVLGGAVLGYLVGGAIVWGTRLLGTLAFGKEAMGLGDVHLMAAAGAVIGAADITLAFFVAPFLGLISVLLNVGAEAVLKRRVKAIPYGPYLAGAVVLVMLFGEQIMSLVMRQSGV